MMVLLLIAPPQCADCGLERLQLMNYEASAAENQHEQNDELDEEIVYLANGRNVRKLQASPPEICERTLPSSEFQRGQENSGPETLSCQ
jgi:hypothetical protein